MLLVTWVPKQNFLLQGYPIEGMAGPSPFAMQGPPGQPPGGPIPSSSEPSIAPRIDCPGNNGSTKDLSSILGQMHPPRNGGAVRGAAGEDNGADGEISESDLDTLSDTKTLSALSMQNSMGMGNLDLQGGSATLDVLDKVMVLLMLLFDGFPTHQPCYKRGE